MTQPALELFNQRAFAVKIEVAEGVDIVPDVTAADAILLMNGTIAVENDSSVRVIDRPFLTNDPTSITNVRLVITGDSELFCPAAPGQSVNGLAPNDALLQIGGMTSVKNAGANTTKYNPISRSIPSASIYSYQDDLWNKGLGARNDITSIMMQIGTRLTMKNKIQGNYLPEVEFSLPTANLYTTQPVVSTYDNSEAYITAPSADSAVPGTELLVLAKSLGIVFNSALKSKEYTSKKFQGITDRKATWTMRVAKTALADFNVEAVRIAGTFVTARYRTYESGVFGKRSGPFTEIGIRGQIITAKRADIDKDLGWDLTGNCIATNAGGDEFYILFGNDSFAISGTLPTQAAGSYVHTLTTTGRSTAPVTWSATGLGSSGITINSSTGATSGTAITGTYAVVVTATDAAAQTSTYTTSLVIS